MKYIISAINQLGIADQGFLDKTDLVDWALLDYIYDWQLNPKAVFKDRFVWLNYKHAQTEMPLLGLRTKSAVSNRIKKLRALNLLETQQDGEDFRLYAKTTDLYFEVTRFKSEPSVLGNKTIKSADLAKHPVHENEHPFTKMNTPVHENEHPVHENEHPVHENEHSTIIQDNHNTNNHNTREPLLALSAKVDERQESVFLNLPLNETGKVFAVTYALVAEFVILYPAVDVEQAFRAMLGWLIANPTKRKTKRGIGRFINAWLSKVQDSGGNKARASPVAEQRVRKFTDFGASLNQPISAEFERIR